MGAQARRSPWAGSKCLIQLSATLPCCFAGLPVCYLAEMPEYLITALPSCRDADLLICSKLICLNA